MEVTRRRSIALGPLMMLTLIATLGPSTVAATNFGSSGCGPDPAIAYCIANNYTHAVYFDDLESLHATATTLSLANDFDPTDLVAYETTTTAYDVIVSDGNFGSNGWWGYTFCPSTATTGGTNPNVWCRGQVLRYNTTYRTVAFSTPLQRAYMACHELGHTVGLRHTTDSGSCMYPDLVTTGVLTGHDIAHINSKYNPY